MIIIKLKKIISTLIEMRFKLTSMLMILIIKILNKEATIGKGFTSNGLMSLNLHRNSTILFGQKVVFNNTTRSNFIGLNKKSTIFVGNNAKLEIGDNSGFSNVSLHAIKAIKIGKYCNIGGNCFIWDSDFHPIDYIKRREHIESKINSLPVVIGDDVFIGANSIILKGVSIGNMSVIGAGSVVTKSIPDKELWAGNPAKFIRKIV
ncbi:MAG: acyltransferase [Sphingobacteriales bacterium]|nr:MAG: acyltransferase [Sphingobacteriales bacterium]TAF83186.1 MAG: acyltransferase [Sphingobacteriales bacterium]